MTTAERFILWPLLHCLCGGDPSGDKTCLRTVITYTGSKSVQAFTLRTSSDDGGRTLFFDELPLD